jgi:hypothetical protein
LSNLIIDYIEIHKKEIEDDMNTCLKTVKKDKKTSSRKKREELSLSATRGLSKKNIPVQLMFD